MSTSPLPSPFPIQTIKQHLTPPPTGSRKNVLPGTLLFATFGALGQAAYNYADARKTNEDADEAGKKKGWMNSRWSPVKTLSDEEYRGILEERLLRLDAEIALVEESIEGVKKAAGMKTVETGKGEEKK